MVHDEPDRIATFAAAKTFVDFFARRDRERGGLLMVKRTIAEIVGASFFELDKTADDVNDVDSVLNLLYGLLADQECKSKFF